MADYGVPLGLDGDGAVIGRLSDLYGRKPFLMGGIVVFLVGSALSGAAGSMEELIGYRVVQGFGAGLIMANAFTILGDLFAPADRARWMGLFAGTFALANVVGPLAAGSLRTTRRGDGCSISIYRSVRSPCWRCHGSCRGSARR